MDVIVIEKRVMEAEVLTCHKGREMQYNAENDFDAHDRDEVGLFFWPIPKHFRRGIAVKRIVTSKQTSKLEELPIEDKMTMVRVFLTKEIQRLHPPEILYIGDPASCQSIENPNSRHPFPMFSYNTNRQSIKLEY